MPSRNPGERGQMDELRYQVRQLEAEKDEFEVLCQQALSTIEFLHGCLTRPSKEGVPGGFSYDYPEQTEQFMEELKSVLPERDWCIHSRIDPDCRGCQQGVRAREIRGRIKERMDNPS
jgi:hypothetical protein